MSLQPARRRPPYDLVIKKYRGPCRAREVEVLERDYRILKMSLEDIVPNTIFVPTRTAEGIGAVAVSHAVVPWFNLANPINEADAIPLFRKLPKARNQLMRFCHAARKWAHEVDGKIIDLYGLDNLVLDTNREVRYLDSFHVFFYADVGNYIDEDDHLLMQKIGISINRFEYLEHLLAEVWDKS